MNRSSINGLAAMRCGVRPFNSRLGEAHPLCQVLVFQSCVVSPGRLLACA